jgi:hypothetical protein
MKNSLPLSLLLLMISNCFVEHASAATVSLPAAKDNTLFESAVGDLSNGAGQFLFAGTIAGPPLLRRGLIAFDVGAAVPSGARIDAVRLQLRMSRTISGATDMTIHRLIKNWGEGTSNANGQEGRGATPSLGDATWTHSESPTIAWTEVGGDYASTASAAQSVGGIGVYTWGSTQQLAFDVQSWLDNPASNYGWLLKGDETTAGTAKRFDSREHPTVANRPTLEIEYTVVPEPCTFSMVASLLLTCWIAPRLSRVSGHWIRGSSYLAIG